MPVLCFSLVRLAPCVCLEEKHQLLTYSVLWHFSSSSHVLFILHSLQWFHHAYCFSNRLRCCCNTSPETIILWTFYHMGWDQLEYICLQHAQISYDVQQGICFLCIFECPPFLKFCLNVFLTISLILQAFPYTFHIFLRPFISHSTLSSFIQAGRLLIPL